MTHTFRPRKTDGNKQNNNNQNRQRGRRKEGGLPQIDQVELDQLPEIDFNFYDKMTAAELAKECKKQKIDMDQHRWQVIELLVEAANPDQVYGKGILEMVNDGWGFLRRDNYQPTPQDIYVSQTQVKKHALKQGDTIYGLVRTPKEGEKYRGLLRVESNNGYGTNAPELQSRREFDKLTPI